MTTLRSPSLVWWLLSCAAVSLAFVLSPRPAGAQELRQEIAADGGFNGRFGYALAIDGDTLISGDPEYYETEALPQCRSGWGAVTVYKKASGTWAFSQRFKYTTIAGITDDEHKFGNSVSLRGNVMVASSPREYYFSSATGQLSQAGAFFVYRRPSSAGTFSLVQRVFAPVPVAGSSGGGLGLMSGVATNGTYVAVAEHPAYGARIFVYQIGATAVTNVSTITLPNPSRASKLFITDSNVLVVMSTPGTAAPFAYALSGSQATPVDTSLLVEPFATTFEPMAGSVNTVAWLRSSGPAQKLVVAKFGTASVQSAEATLLPPEHTTGFPGPMAVQENQGVVIHHAVAGTHFVSGYKYANGSYRYGGVMPESNLDTLGNPVPFNLTALAFNGTDLFASDAETDHGNPQLGVSCKVDGSLFVYQPLATSVAGPGVSSRMLRPWMHRNEYSNGTAVATSGSFVVSATPDGWQGGTTSGGVTLYQSVNNAWQQVGQFLDAYNALTIAPGWNGFGRAVDLTGDFLAIGVPFAVSQMSGNRCGAVQVARQVGGTFDRGPFLTYVEPGTLAEGDTFGQSVALSGNALIVGAPQLSPTTGGNRGSVYVYDWDGAGWNLTEQLTGSAGTSQDFQRFGEGVSASGSNLIVGIPARSSAGRSEVGSVQIFVRSGTHYTSVGDFAAPSQLGAGAALGTAVSIGADFAAAGTVTGAVVTYRRVNASSWVQDQVITSTAGGFGTAVALEGTRLVVGAIFQNTIYRYDRSNTRASGTWSLTNSLGGSTLDNYFGTSVDLSNGRVIAGDSAALVGTTFNGASIVLNYTDIRP